MKSNTTEVANLKKKRRCTGRITLLILAVVLLSFFVFILFPDNVEVYTSTGSISASIETLQPEIIELNHISVKKQPDAVTCGITAVTVMSNYYNNTDYEANDLIAKHNSKGNTDGPELLRRELPGRNITFKSNGLNDEMIGDIHASLKSNNPVMVYFGAPNPYNEPFYDSHGSVVYGLNLDIETITIANSYGYREEISLVAFLNRMSYTERDKYTAAQRFLWKFIGVPKNQYIMVE